MKRIIALILILLMAGPVQAAQWRNASDTGTAENTLLGSESASDIALRSYTDIVTPLDSLLTNYREGMDIVFDTVSQFTVSSGEVTVKNSGGTTKLFLSNSGNTTVTWANIDTGAEASATTYYVYAIAASSSATAATFKISTNATTPSGVTYYKKIGSFYNDGSSNITWIDNDNDVHDFGTWESKSESVIYQAQTDGFFIGIVVAGTNTSAGKVLAYSDSSATPTTIRGAGNTLLATSTISQTSATNYGSFCIPVKKGDYYQGVLSSAFSGSTATAVYYWFPID